MSKRTRVLLVGVGGHGVVTSARILGEAARELGMPVRIGQIHGMSQRGGSVESTVIFGPGKTALIGEGEADLVLGFEPIETWRAVSRMAAHAVVAANVDRVSSYDMSRRGEAYPELESIFSTLRAATRRVMVIDAPMLARASGDPRTVGTVLIGAAVGLGALPFGPAPMLAAIERACPAAALDANRRAFAAGLEDGERELANTGAQLEGRVTI